MRDHAVTADNTRGTGAHWEGAALAYLLHNGLRLIERNFTCRFGEIDLIVRDRDALVFVEVRYRGDAAHGGGAVSVGSAKRAKLVRAATLYLQVHPELAVAPCRFDVIGCSATLAAPKFEWIRSAFEAF
jgi:putative endonuclease